MGGPNDRCTVTTARRMLSVFFVSAFDPRRSCEGRRWRGRSSIPHISLCSHSAWRSNLWPSDLAGNGTFSWPVWTGSLDDGPRASGGGILRGWIRSEGRRSRVTPGLTLPAARSFYLVTPLSQNIPPSSMNRGSVAARHIRQSSPKSLATRSTLCDTVSILGPSSARMQRIFF